MLPLQRRMGMVTGVVAVSALALTACAPSGTDGPTTVRIGVASDPGSMDPHRSIAGVNIDLVRFAYETPVNVDSSGELIPGVVTEWAFDGNGYALTVQDGVTCSDDSVLTAQTVATNINYVAGGESPYLGLALPPGAHAVAEGDTVRVELAEPSPFFMHNLAFLPLVCDAGLEDRSLLIEGSVGSGPYEIVDVDPGQSISYRSRAAEDDTATSDVPEDVFVQIVPDANTRANMLVGGELDIAPLSGQAEVIAEQAGLTARGNQTLSHQLNFNQSPAAILNEEGLRQALVSVVDLEVAAQLATSGRGEPARGFQTEPAACTMDSGSPVRPPASEAEATTALDDLGWVESGDIRARDGAPLRVTILHDSSDAGKKALAEYLAEQWRSVGVDVAIDRKPMNQVVEAILGGGGAWDVVLDSVEGSNPAFFVPTLSGAAPPDGRNFGHIDNASYNDLVSQAIALEGTEGCAFWLEAEAAIIDAADSIPVATTPKNLWSSGVEFELVTGSRILPTSLHTSD